MFQKIKNYLYTTSSHKVENEKIAYQVFLGTNYETILQKEKAKTFDFYKRLRLWPITNLSKKYTINSILIPSMFKSHKLREILQGNYVDPKYLFLKNIYLQKDNSGKVYRYQYDFLKTLRIVLQYKLLIRKLKKNYPTLKLQYSQLYKQWSEYEKWNELFIGK